MHVGCHLRQERALLLLLVLLATVYLAPARVLACYCMPAADPLVARDEAQAVFRGKVIGIQRTGGGFDPLRITFSVAETWKGPAAHFMVVKAWDKSSSCGYEFAMGQEYVVYAEQVQGKLMTSICERTAPIGNARADIRALGQGMVPGAPQAEERPEEGAGGGLGGLALPLLIVVLVALAATGLALLRRPQDEEPN